MDIITIMIIVGIIVGICAKIFQSRNENYTKSEVYMQNMQDAENYIRSILSSDENMLLIDNPYGLKDIVVLTTKAVYYIKKGNITFRANYSDITKCKYTNFSGDKVKPYGDVVHIKLRSNTGKCNLYSFPKAKEIAAILNRYTA